MPDSARKKIALGAAPALCRELLQRAADFHLGSSPASIRGNTQSVASGYGAGVARPSEPNRGRLLNAMGIDSQSSGSIRRDAWRLKFTNRAG